MAIELRNHLFRVPTLSSEGEGNIGMSRYRKWRTGPAESETQRTYAKALCTETGRSHERPFVYPQTVRSRKACGRNLDMHATGKSD
jgi:hypothetical protein